MALAREALRQVLPAPAPLRVLTGMPAAWFADASARQQLADAIVAAARPWGPAHVTVAPEPAGIYYDYLFERGGLDLGRKAEQVGVFDLGYRDAGVAWFSASRYAGGESVPGGMAESLREIKRLADGQYHATPADSRYMRRVQIQSVALDDDLGAEVLRRVQAYRPARKLLLRLYELARRIVFGMTQNVSLWPTATAETA